MPKISELFTHSQQLKKYWVQSKPDMGDMAQNFVRGYGLGYAIGGLVAGPIGIALAVGTNYLIESEKQEKQEKIEDELINNWAKTHDMLYLTQLKEYHFAYQKLCLNIMDQVSNNFKEAEKFAQKLNKREKFIAYINEEVVSMPQDSKTFENLETWYRYFDESN